MLSALRTLYMKSVLRMTRYGLLGLLIGLIVAVLAQHKIRSLCSNGREMALGFVNLGLRKLLQSIEDLSPKAAPNGPWIALVDTIGGVNNPAVIYMDLMISSCWFKMPKPEPETIQFCQVALMHSAGDYRSDPSVDHCRALGGGELNDREPRDPEGARSV